MKSVAGSACATKGSEGFGSRVLNAGHRSYVRILILRVRGADASIKPGA